MCARVSVSVCDMRIYVFVCAYVCARVSVCDVCVSARVPVCIARASVCLHPPLYGFAYLLA